MFDYIYDWLWNFVCYMVLMTALIQVLPENSYQKYLKFLKIKHQEKVEKFN